MCQGGGAGRRKGCQVLFLLFSSRARIGAAAHWRVLDVYAHVLTERFCQPNLTPRLPSSHQSGSLLRCVSTSSLPVTPLPCGQHLIWVCVPSRLASRSWVHQTATPRQQKTAHFTGKLSTGVLKSGRHLRKYLPSRHIPPPPRAHTNTPQSRSSASWPR